MQKGVSIVALKLRIRIVQHAEAAILALSDHSGATVQPDEKSLTCTGGETPAAQSLAMCTTITTTMVRRHDILLL